MLNHFIYIQWKCICLICLLLIGPYKYFEGWRNILKLKIKIKQNKKYYPDIGFFECRVTTFTSIDHLLKLKLKKQGV